jgi:hypothetical protein
MNAAEGRPAPRAISVAGRRHTAHTVTMEGGTLLGFAVAGAAGLLVAAGSALARSRRIAPSPRRVIGMTLLIALLAAVFGVFVVVGVGVDAWLNATAPSCSYGGEGNAACVPLDNVGKQAAGMGLLGDICAGVLAGLITAWRMSRSLRLVLGGLIATLGATVLLAESLAVLALWAA